MTSSVRNWTGWWCFSRLHFFTKWLKYHRLLLTLNDRFIFHCCKPNILNDLKELNVIFPDTEKEMIISIKIEYKESQFQRWLSHFNADWIALGPSNFLAVFGPLLWTLSMIINYWQGLERFLKYHISLVRQCKKLFHIYPSLFVVVCWIENSTFHAGMIFIRAKHQLS